MADAYRCSDWYDFSQGIDIFIVHADTAMRYVVANRRRVVGAVNAVMRLAQSEPVGAKHAERTAGIRIRVRDFADDREISLWGRCREFA